MNAVARDHPALEPPDGLVLRVRASHQPTITTGPVNSKASIRTALLGSGTSRSHGLVDRRPLTARPAVVAARCSPRRRR